MVFALARVQSSANDLKLRCSFNATLERIHKKIDLLEFVDTKLIFL